MAASFVAITHSLAFVVVRYFGVGGFAVALASVVFRIPVTNHRRIAEGNPPLTFTLRGIQPMKDRKWWFVTWFVKTPEGWQRLDRWLMVLAAIGVLAFLVTIGLTGPLGLK